MPKRRPNGSAEPLDIFSNPRLGAAMAAATSPEPVLPPVRDSAALPPPLALRSVPSGESRPSAPQVASAPAAEAASELHAEPSAPALAPAPKPSASALKGREAAPEAPAAEALPEPNVPLKFRVPQTLRSEFQTFKAELSAALGGVALDDSNLGRPLLEHFLVEQRDRILEAASAFKGRMRRPANGDTVGMAEFDHALGEIFSEARKRRRASATAGEA